jgi:hypothetical protein
MMHRATFANDNALRRFRSTHILVFAFGRHSLVLFGRGFNAITRIVGVAVVRGTR